MCRFLSGIGFHDGSIASLPEYTNSHEDLITYLGLRDKGALAGRFVRWEFMPADEKDFGNPDAYKLTIDEDRTPDWCTEKLQAKYAAKAKAMIQKMIVSDKRLLLLGGCHILVKTAHVETIKNATIAAMLGSARIDSMWGSARIDRMGDYARIDSMGGSARIDSMGDSARIDRMWDSAEVGLDERPTAEKEANPVNLAK